jgi:predicted LPLAT superfamily acyltransferase
MIGFIYQLIISLSKRLGIWVFKVFSWWIATGYFFFIPVRVARSMQFYKALFPDRGFWHCLWCAWRQYHNFTTVYMDRFLLQHTGDIAVTREGWEHLHQALKNGTGGILLMSHMGSWEIAAHLLKTKGFKLLLYLGERHREQIEKTQKQSLQDLGIRIIAVSPDGGSPFDIVEGIQFLREGGFVSLTGDRLWSEGQRTVAVEFLGHRVDLPETPHIFALLSGAPLFMFFVSRVGDRSYRVIVSEPCYVKAASRAERQQAVQASAQAYADMLAREVRLRPDEWYHFEPFLGPKLSDERENKESKA